jgi:hypothetical protein
LGFSGRRRGCNIHCKCKSTEAFNIFSSASIIGKFTVLRDRGGLGAARLARQLAQLRPSVPPESNQPRISSLQSKGS